MSLNKNFFIRLVTGVALTVVGLDAWGRYLERRVATGANPWLIQPFLAFGSPQMPKSSQGLPRLILPTAANTIFDQWMIQPLGERPVPFIGFKGKVVFLNLWSTTCAPCIEEMPGMEKLLRSLQGEPVVFLAVTREHKLAVRSFLQKHPIHLPVYVTDEDAPEYIRATVVPMTLILDRSGKIVCRNAGAMNWDDDNARKFIRDLEKQ